MLSFNNETSRGLVLKAYNEIIDMLTMENLYINDDKEKIYARIIKIENMKPFIPRDVFDLFVSFIEDNIIPIIDDKLAIKKFMTAEFGFINKDGIYEFRDEKSIKYFFGSIIEYCVGLEKDFLKLSMNIISPYFQ